VKNANSSTYSYTISAAAGFVLCANITGTVQWVSRIDGGTVQSVTVSGEYIIVTGRFTTTASFYTANTNTLAQTITGTSGIQNMFLAAYNTSGSVLWATVGTASSTITTNIIRTSSSTVVVGGGFAGTSLALKNANGTTGLSITNNATETAFIASYT